LLGKNLARRFVIRDTSFFSLFVFALRSTEGILPSSGECAIHIHKIQKDFSKSLNEAIRTPRKSQPPILREAGGIVHISSRCLCCCQDFELSFSAANSLHMSQCIADAGLSSEVLTYSVVRVDFDQSHCVSFDFDDLKISHDSFPCVLCLTSFA
jgi:hypothetical protein